MPTDMGTIPSLPPPTQLQLQNPPSPNTHRLRRLQSAHNLGAKAAGQSLISQQRLQQQQQQHYQPQTSLYSQNMARQDQRAMSPVRRMRANSDARGAPHAAPPLHKRAAKRNVTADAMSLERLLSKGPPEGDVDGALESTRFKILTQGIKADNDGMVSKALA
jgi:cell cycle arrest protein BUB2